MTLLPVFKVLLYRYTGQADIVVGVPIAGRDRAEVEHVQGLFLNTLLLRTQLTGELRFSDLLERVRETTLGAYAHQELPFERLVEELQPQRDMSRNPLYQVTFNKLIVQPLSPEAVQAAQSPGSNDTAVAELDVQVDLALTGTSAAATYPLASVTARPSSVTTRSSVCWRAGTLGFAVAGADAQLPPWSVGYVYLPAVLGVVPTSTLVAPLGARLAHRLPTAVLRRSFAAFLTLVGAKMLLGA